MKYLLVCFPLLIARQSAAQQIVLGAAAGLSANHVPRAVADAMTVADGGINFLWAAKAAIGLKHFQAGIGFDATKISYQYPLYPGGLLGQFNLRSEVSLVNPYVFANYKVPIKRTHVYFGLNGGYALLGDRKNKASFGSTGYAVSYTASPSGDGVSWGVQAGFSMPMWKGFSVQAELGARRIPFSSGYTTLSSAVFHDDLHEVPVNTVVWIFPAMIGVNYSFGLKE